VKFKDFQFFQSNPTSIDEVEKAILLDAQKIFNNQ
jgi:hypothetical protein